MLSCICITLAWIFRKPERQVSFIKQANIGFASVLEKQSEQSFLQAMPSYKFAKGSIDNVLLATGLVDAQYRVLSPDMSYDIVTIGNDRFVFEPFNLPLDVMAKQVKAIEEEQHSIGVNLPQLLGIEFKDWEDDPSEVNAWNADKLSLVEINDHIRWGLKAFLSRLTNTPINTSTDEVLEQLQAKPYHFNQWLEPLIDSRLAALLKEVDGQAFDLPQTTEAGLLQFLDNCKTINLHDLMTTLRPMNCGHILNDLFDTKGILVADYQKQFNNLPVEKQIVLTTQEEDKVHLGEFAELAW